MLKSIAKRSAFLIPTSELERVKKLISDKSQRNGALQAGGSARLKSKTTAWQLSPDKG